MGFGIPAEQVSIMFLLIFLGWVAYRLGWIRQDTVKGMTNLLLYIVSPCVVINAFHRPFDPERLQMVGVVFALDVGAFACSILLVRLLFTRRLVPDAHRRTALRFGAVYSNAGFMGIPLAQALLGNDGVFFAVAYIAAFTVFVWTQGISMFDHERTRLSERVGKVLRNPNMVAIAIALIVFGFSLPIPSILGDALGHVGAMNTPLSMIVIGGNVAALSPRTIISDRLAWLGTLARNLLIPLVFVGLLALLPLPADVRLSILIPISCPVGASVVMFSVLRNADSAFATRLLCLSTLLSVGTVPSIIALASLVW
jgi:predicted permease